MQTYHLVNVHATKGSKVRDVKKLMKFAWDDEKTSQSPEEIIRVAKAIAATFVGSKKKKDGKGKRR